jgi:hypothetical protein
LGPWLRFWVRLNLSLSLVGASYVGRLVFARIVYYCRDLGGLVVLVNHPIPESPRPLLNLRRSGPTLPHPILLTPHRPIPSLPSPRLGAIPLNPRNLVTSLLSTRLLIASLLSARVVVASWVRLGWLVVRRLGLCQLVALPGLRHLVARLAGVHRGFGGGCGGEGGWAGEGGGFFFVGWGGVEYGGDLCGGGVVVLEVCFRDELRVRARVGRGRGCSFPC